MTILFVANTPADFLADASGSGLVHNTDTTHRDSNYVPNDIQVESNQTAFAIPDFASEVTDFWLHMRHRTGRMFVGGADGVLLQFYDGDEDEIARLDFNNDAARAGAVGDTTVYGNEYALPDRKTVTIDINVELTGGNIVCRYYANGSLVSTATAANTGTKGGVQRAVIAISDVSYDNRDLYFSEIIATDGESTVGWRLACLEPDSAGNYSDFDGDYTDLGDANIATAAGTDTNNDRVSSGVSAYGGPASPAGIRAVVAKCVATKGDTGPGTLKQFLRIGGTDYDGSGQALTIGNVGYMEVWDNDPSTASGWDTSTLASIEVGVKAEA